MSEPAQARAPGPSRAGRPAPSGTPARRLLADRLARWVVTAGGMTIIASILGILLFILIEVFPLASGASLSPGASVSLAAPAGSVLSDEYRSHAAVLSEDGCIRVYAMASGELTDAFPIVAREGANPGARRDDTVPCRDSTPLYAVGVAPGQQLFAAATPDGAVFALPFEWPIEFIGQQRMVTPRPGRTVRFHFDESGRPVGPFSVRVDDDEVATGAALLADGSVVLLRREVEENLLTGEVSETWHRDLMTAPRPPQHLLLDIDGSNLYGATASGELLWWSLSGDSGQARVVGGTAAEVTSLTLLLGDRSLVVGRADGVTEIWFPVRQADGSFELTRIRQFPPLSEPVRLLAPSMRDKGFLAVGPGGELALNYSTSGRALWTGPVEIDRPETVFFAPKADAALIGGKDRLIEVLVSSPHPEVGFRALLGKVWYESYPEPELVWQSSGGTDDFESKLSLTPLIVGTLKGTVYSLLLAIPLGVLGAMYTSQFMHPSLKRYVKPTVEIMAALPSVVLGFLAGLWLAPRVERVIPGLFAALIIVPMFVLITGMLWRSLSTTRWSRMADGIEVPVYMVVVAVAVWLSLSASKPLENLLFGGRFQGWLLEVTGLPFDQRNAVVVGLAMGFAVIPIIFSIAEDAFSNVPRSLTSGSLALGANRWQTVTRVVLPTASPGIFSAIMIGFGRAIGETMIVLMATGNTPIMDWNPFNGFRTLSANIAVEIPEAPHGGTLYRTLFLAALLLFVFTFAINTVAELIRQRLRERYQY